MLARHGSVSMGRSLVASQCVVFDQAESQATLFVDVSVLAKHDAKTGIQRIVRGVLQTFLEDPPFQNVQLVCASRRQGYRRAYWDSRRACVVTEEGSDCITPSIGDVFLALDLAAHILPAHFCELVRYKAQGMKIVSLVYDLLPESNPEWFNPKTVRNYRRWLRASAKLADGFVTISHTVKNDLQAWLAIHGIDSGHIPIVAIQFAVDIDQSYPTKGLPSNSTLLVENFSAVPTVLMVGTVEPRKGYEEALNAFEYLWKSEQKTCLVIVGKPGWKTERLQQRISSHPLKGKKLFWFSDASDEWLAQLYEVCRLVLVASKGEGLGLPVIEGMARGRALLARDLPVFREVAGEHISYFEDDSPESMGSKIISMLQIPSVSTPANKLSWSTAAAELSLFLRAISMTSLKSADQYCS